MKKLSLLERIISVRNVKTYNSKTKYLFLLGLKIRLWGKSDAGILSEPRYDKRIKERHAVKSVLIFKPDTFGDYVLWRNFMPEIKKSEKFRNAKITIVVSDRTLGFSDVLDAEYADKFLYIPNQFDPNGIPHKDIINILLRQGLESYYDAVLILHTSATLPFYQRMLSHVAAREVILEAASTPLNQYPFALTRVVCRHHVLPNIGWEFDRHKYTFEQMIEEKINQTIPVIDTKIIPAAPMTLPKEFVIINPGAREYRRVWDLRNFATLVEHIKQKHRLPVVLLTAETDKGLGEKLQSYTNVEMQHISGLSPMEAMAVMKKAALYIGCDTGFTHIAIAMGLKTVAIASAMYPYVEFLSYPKSDRYTIVVPEGVEEIKERLLGNKDRGLSISANLAAYNGYFGHVNMNSLVLVRQAVDKLLGASKPIRKIGKQNGKD
jgi:ADP-heptose:LPS heptosyltransferase